MEAEKEAKRELEKQKEEQKWIRKQKEIGLIPYPFYAEPKEKETVTTQSNLPFDYHLNKIKEAEALEQARQGNIKIALDNLAQARKELDAAKSKGTGVPEAHQKYLLASKAFQDLAPNKGKISK